MTRLAWKTRLIMTGAMALALGACNDPATRNASQPSALAVLDPTAAVLPPAPPAPVARYEPAQGYRLAERAYGVQRAVYDAPPDYGFAYGEEEPWAWQTADDWSMYAEPWDDGYRYYYYQPGATYPYFVRDDDYGYGYDRGGTLVVVVDAAGRYLPLQEYRRVAPIAGRYYAHGSDLRRAGLRAERIRVDERTWAARAPRVTQGADRWLAAAREDRAWRQWRETDRNRELDRFNAEQVRRAEAQRGRVAAQDRRDELRRDEVRRDDNRSRLAELRLRQDDQARAADRQARDAAARGQAERQGQAERASVQQRQRAELERQQRAHDNAREAQVREVQAREVQARDARARQQQVDAHQREQHQAQQAQAREARDRQQQADARQREQHQAQQAQAKAAHDRQMQAQAQDHARHQAEQAQARQAHDRQMQAQNAQREAQHAQQARAAQDHARAAQDQARAAAAHERASSPPRPQEHARPTGKPDGRGKDKEKKD